MGATERDHYDAAFGVDSGEVDPYACYEELRRHGPLVDLGDGRWFTTGYAIGMEALRNNGLGVDMERVGRDRGGADWRDHPSLTLLESTLLARNPPDHGVLRKAVNHAFAPPAVAAIEAQVKDTIDRLLGELAEQDHPDFIRDFADPLPVSVIGPILGIPSAARADFQSNTLQFNLVFEHEQGSFVLECSRHGEAYAIRSRDVPNSFRTLDCFAPLDVPPTATGLEFTLPRLGRLAEGTPPTRLFFISESY